MKNVILLAVVACGLAAAGGCERPAASPSPQDGAAPQAIDDVVEVPVAAKDIILGTRLIKEELKDYVTYKKISKHALPTEFATSEEQLVDRRVARTIRAGEPFNPRDLAPTTFFEAMGLSGLCFEVSSDKVPSSVRPGSKVDVLATFKLRKQEKLVVVPVLTNMEVLSMDDISVNVPPGAPPLPIRVALAFNNKQAAILHATLSRGADVRLVVRHPDKPSNDCGISEQEIWAILADEDWVGHRNHPIVKAPELIKLPIPTEELKAGTQLTAAVIGQKFKMVDYVAPAPPRLVQNLKEYTGYYLQHDLGAEQFVPVACLGEKPPERNK